MQTSPPVRKPAAQPIRRVVQGQRSVCAEWLTAVFELVNEPRDARRSECFEMFAKAIADFQSLFMVTRSFAKDSPVLKGKRRQAEAGLASLRLA